jgi:hypothetical protein
MQELVKKIKGRSPFPWRQLTHPNGLIEIYDADNKIVSLLDIINLSIALTEKISEGK